ncbi:MAG: (d)CMP kinase [Gemmataceae bacterium]
MIVTIDGPAGAGKSSAAKALAQRLGFEVLDTGAMYRAVALAALRAQIDLDDQAALAHLLTTIRLDLPSGKVLMNGEDVTHEIRTAAVTAATVPIADSPVVRQQLVNWQRQIAAGRDMICEGRDQGSIVFPEAACKFFLRADPVERARRRQQEMAARGESVDLETLLRAQEERDRRDTARDLAPMVAAVGAQLLDSTHLSLKHMVDLMEKEVRRCQSRH